MSKSKGNVVTPMALLEEHGTDAVRYWASRGAPGTDTAFDTGQMKIGRRLAIKLLNASKFALGLGSTTGGTPTEALDLAMLAQLAEVVSEATTAFEGYDYTRALDRTESFFWRFCDDYVELVKGRAYGEGPAAESAKAALGLALSTLQRLFAPFLPFVTEEVWSWWQEASVHRAAWPTAGELTAGGDPAVLDTAAEILGQVRKAKTEAKQSMRAEVATAVVHGPADLAKAAETDIREAGRILDLSYAGGDELRVEVTLA
jgi:valyl-tRNA synthetase